jgi:hypothetical protein
VYEVYHGDSILDMKQEEDEEEEEEEEEEEKGGHIRAYVGPSNPGYFHTLSVRLCCLNL